MGARLSSILFHVTDLKNGENRSLRNIIAYVHTILRRRIQKVSYINAHNSEKLKSQHKVVGWLMELD
jgi:hypothetical protein